VTRRDAIYAAVLVAALFALGLLLATGMWMAGAAHADPTRHPAPPGPHRSVVSGVPNTVDMFGRWWPPCSGAYRCVPWIPQPDRVAP
jgi:hypothetical protein